MTCVGYILIHGQVPRRERGAAIGCVHQQAGPDPPSVAVRGNWSLERPHGPGGIVDHFVLDQRGRKTMLVAWGIGHACPTILGSQDRDVTRKEARL